MRLRLEQVLWRHEPGTGVDHFRIRVTASTYQPPDLSVPGMGTGSALSIMGGKGVVPHTGGFSTNRDYIGFKAKYLIFMV